MFTFQLHWSKLIVTINLDPKKWPWMKEVQQWNQIKTRDAKRCEYLQRCKKPIAYYLSNRIAKIRLENGIDLLDRKTHSLSLKYASYETHPFKHLHRSTFKVKICFFHLISMPFFQQKYLWLRYNLVEPSQIWALKSRSCFTKHSE